MKQLFKYQILTFALFLSLTTPNQWRAYAGEVERDPRAENHGESPSVSEAREEFTAAAVRSLGTTRPTLRAELARYSSDNENISSLVHLLRQSDADPEILTALKSYLALSKASHGRISVYPLELKEILETWPKAKSKAFVETLEQVAEQSGRTQGSMQDALEDALKRKRLLSEYRANKTVVSLGILQGISLDAAAKRKLGAIAASYEVPSGDIKSVMSEIYLKIHEGSGTSQAKAEKMALAGNKIVEATSSANDSSKRNISFAVATCVIRLEQFQREEYVSEPFKLTIDPSYPHEHFTQYAEWAKSFIEGTPRYSTAPAGSLLTIKDIRDMMSQNEWPVGMRPHDTRHIHYAVGHPRGVALVFESARSKNLIRHRLLGALYEAVDTVQYGYERSISAYFRNKGMDLEQSLVFIARADEATLKQIHEEGTQNSDLMATDLTNWRLPIHGEYDGLGKSGIGFEAEVDSMVRTLLRMGQDPANRYWMNYSQSVSSGAGHVDQDDPSNH